VQVFLLISNTTGPSLIESVGQTGLQSPQEMHSSATIYKAMATSYKRFACNVVGIGGGDAKGSK
jgi:hypothetical protein